jgi:radical SAM superfamily enzyme YgiQ (UPF0313 family)
MTVRLLLINPKFPESFWSFNWALREILPRKRALNPPLGLATLAALCPPSWQVRIVDENIESIPLAPDADIVGVCGMGVQVPRQLELLAYYRVRGYLTVAGGSYASLCPERYEGHADVIVSGEAENIWPRFCADFVRGAPERLYRETGLVKLEDAPTPRFDLLQLEHYTSATLQFSRGCPYLCEFCDIIVMFGRKPRFKTVAQIERELDALRAAGARNAFFVDDNLIGNRPAARALLAFLARYQRQHGYPLRFGTELTLNVAQDDALLQALREAGFMWVFIGIETPDEAALQETRKTQNTRQDMLASVRRIYAHGVDVLAGFIIGFDGDTPASFERQRQFIMHSGIQAAMIGLLTALPRTPLYARLETEGRLSAANAGTDNTSLGTNVVPKNMSTEVMIAGYRRLYEDLLSDSAIAERIRHKLRYMARPHYRGEYELKEQALIVLRLLLRGLLPGGARRLAHFLRTLPLRAPSRLPFVVTDWITGLAMRDYVERRLAPPRADAQARAQRFVAAAARALARHAQSEQIVFSHPETARPHITLRLDAGLDRQFFRRAARELERLLRHTSSRLTLQVETLGERERAHFARMLEKLARHGDRVSIAIAEHLREVVPVDSSKFHLVLAPRAKA